jgi:hypothetical protein
MRRILILILLNCSHSFVADRKPNFLFLFTDDQRWDAA